MPEISIIVPVYNTEKYLYRCVDSILGQTFTDFELILIDDGSTDASGDICDEYRAADSRVRVVHQNNRGQAAARNLGAAIAEGRWLSFVDSDDMLHPQMLASMYDVAFNNNADISMCSFVEGSTVPDDFNKDLEYKVELIDINENTLFEISTSPKNKGRAYIVYAKLIKKEIVKKYPFENGRIFEDNAVILWWLQEAKIVANIDAAFYFYFTNPTGTMGSKITQKKVTDNLWSEEERLLFYKKNNYQKLISREYRTLVLLSAWYIRELNGSKTNRSFIFHLKKKCLKIWVINRKDIELSKNEKEYILGSLLPKTIKLYSYIEKKIYS